MAGELNGTGVYVLMDTTVGGSNHVQIGGQNSHTLTLNNNPIDTTNKSSSSYRELLAGEGTQSVDLTLELTFNSEATFASLRTLAGSKAQADFQIEIDGSQMQFVGQVASWNDTSPDGDKFTASVTIQSSGSVTWV